MVQDQQPLAQTLPLLVFDSAILRESPPALRLGSSFAEGIMLLALQGFKEEDAVWRGC